MQDYFKKGSESCLVDELEWVDHVRKCIGDKICPKCGSELYPQKQNKFKKAGDPHFFLCLYCGWNDYVGI